MTKEERHKLTQLGVVIETREEGFRIVVPDGVQLEKPIQLVNYLLPPVTEEATHNVIEIGKGAKASVLLCTHSTKGQCVNEFNLRTETEVIVNQDAIYEHCCLEETYAGVQNHQILTIRQAANSEVRVNLLSLHCGKTLNETTIIQEGEGARTELSGLAIGSKKEQIDNQTRIEHQHPHGKSESLFKYALKDEAQALFVGELVVSPNAQKVEAYQQNRNILLSETAKVRTMPQLEIYADDVKCSHGASTGQMDESALFYMQQRGIAPDEARLMLMQAFFDEVVNKISTETLREKIKLLIEKRLRTGDTRCESCR